MVDSTLGNLNPGFDSASGFRLSLCQETLIFHSLYSFDRVIVCVQWNIVNWRTQIITDTIVPVEIVSSDIYCNKHVMCRRPSDGCRVFVTPFMNCLIIIITVWDVKLILKLYNHWLQSFPLKCRSEITLC